MFSRNNKDGVKVYVTASGNKCTRRTMHKHKLPRTSHIVAKSIASFIAEMHDGSELRGGTTLSFKTKTTNIALSPVHKEELEINSISERDATEFCNLNKKCFTKVRIKHGLGRYNSGVLEILYSEPIVDASIEKPDIVCWRLVGQATNLVSLTSTTQAFHPGTILALKGYKMEVLQVLKLTNVHTLSMVAQLGFIKSLESFCNLSVFTWKHGYAYDVTELEFCCILEANLAVENFGRLLNLFSPQRQLLVDMQLREVFEDKYVKKQLTSILSRLNKLTQYSASANFFRQDEVIAIYQGT